MLDALRDMGRITAEEYVDERGRLMFGAPTWLRLQPKSEFRKKTTMHLTPIEIQIYAHYVGSCDDFRDGDFSAPIVGTTITDMHRRGLLEDTTPEQRREGWGKLKGTPKLTAFVTLMGDTPMPEQVWVDPRNGKALDSDKATAVIDGYYRKARITIHQPGDYDVSIAPNNIVNVRRVR